MARVYRLKAGLEMPDSGLPGAPYGGVDCAGIREGADVEDALTTARRSAERLAPDVPTFRMLALVLAALAGEQPLVLASARPAPARPLPDARQAA
jgi:hypothetical protein